MSTENSRTAIIVAVIGASGVIAASIFSNWDKVFAPRISSRPITEQRIASIAKQSTKTQESADEEQLKTIIRDHWSKGSDGQPKNVSFDSFLLGKPFSYRPVDPLAGGSPDGPGGREGATVYPVRATFTVRETYPGRLAFSKRTREFSCFRDEWDTWKCNIVGGGFETETWTTPN